MKHVFIVILYIIFSVYIISCNPILKETVGINKINEYSNTELIQVAHKYSIDSPLYSLNDSYLDYAKSFSDTHTVKNLLQPLQIIFFNHNTVSAHLINCIVGGFPNLKWNRYRTFDSLPQVNRPVITSELQYDSLTKYINPKPELSGNKNICIVFWSNFMGRQSKNLITYSKEINVQKNYQVIYVNNDNFFYYLSIIKSNN